MFLSSKLWTATVQNSGQSCEKGHNRGFKPHSRVMEVLKGLYDWKNTTANAFTIIKTVHKEMNHHVAVIIQRGSSFSRLSLPKAHVSITIAHQKTVITIRKRADRFNDIEDKRIVLCPKDNDSMI